MKDFLKYTRDALCYLFAWLVICVMLTSLISGKTMLEFSFLWKLLAFCVWGAVTFTFCFLTKRMQRRGFLFSLTCFYVLFIPVEVIFFYVTGIFEEVGNAAIWTIFFVIIAALYLASALIDFFIMRKRAKDYTKRLEEYRTAR